MGYWLGKKYWGKGFATEAVGRLLELGFDELDLNEIYASYKVGNKASKKVLEKSGFQFYREKQEFDSALEKDEQLIGGATIRVGDHMIDGSVRSQLSNLNRFLTN